MRFLKFAVLAALFALPVCSANARDIPGILVQPGVVQLEDVDYEIALDTVGNELVVGSRLLAIAKYTTLNDGATKGNIANFDNSTEMITGVTYVEVSSVTVTGGVLADFTLTGLAGAIWGADLGILGVADGTALVAFNDPIPGAGLDHLDQSTVPLGVASASEGTRLFEFGIDNFLTLETVDTGGMPTDITMIDSLTTKGDFTLLANYTGLTLLPHNFLGAANGFASASQLQLVSELQAINGPPDFPGGGFQFITDSDVYLNAVPEPTSVLALVGLFGIAGFKRRRRA